MMGPDADGVDLPAVRQYLEAVRARIAAPRPRAASSIAPGEIPRVVFDCLTRRDFCYLSKRRVARYRESVQDLTAQFVRQAAPIQFYYDIGGGYHASVRPGEEEVSFEVGLGELLMLSQVARFSGTVGSVYAPGVRFWLVIDDLCAVLINDISLERTRGYCQRLRELIRELGLGAAVELMVESEHFGPVDVERVRAGVAGRRGHVSVTRQQHENVERFLGRSCSPAEAAERMERYGSVIEASESLLASVITGVHMTQRATESTICFRSFPGGDARMQCGEVALTTNGTGRVCPVLLTSRNLRQYRCSRHRLPDVLPSGIRDVTYAAPVDAGPGNPGDGAVP